MRNVVEPASKVTLCFVHQGYSPFLEYAVAQAVSCGYRALIIGDKAAKCHEGDFIDIQDFRTSSNLFRQEYRHTSVNPLEYEAFCFERWFVLADFMAIDNRPLWAADHDILVYPGLNTVQDWLSAYPSRKPFLGFNSAWFNFLANAGSARFVAECMLSVFKDRPRLEELSIKHSIDGVPHLSDMHLLLEMGATHPDQVIDVAFADGKFGIDTNFRLPSDFSSRNGHKHIVWDKNIPYSRKGMDMIRFYALHFQGPSKYLMRYLHTISLARFKHYLRDFDEEVKNLGISGIGAEVRAEYADLSRESDL